MKTYRVGILGCRARGTAAARAHHSHPRTEVVAICDLKPELLEALGNELGVSARYNDLDKMIQEMRPDIVAIPTGTEFHHPLAMRVLEYGVNIDVEKPICADLAQADEVMAKAARKGAKVAVHHQGRVGASMKAAWKACQEGRIGKLRYIYGSGKGYYAGYDMMNIGTHLINNAIKFAGHCRGVSAVALVNGRPITPEDVLPAAGGMGIIAGEHVTSMLRFDDNLTANLLFHGSKPDSNAYSMELYGTEGRIVWRMDGTWLLPTPHFIPNGKHDHWEALPAIYPEGFDPAVSNNEMEWWYVDDYVRALDEGRDPECSGAEGRHVLEVLMGIFEAAAYRREVELPQERRDHPLLRWRKEHGLDDPAPMPRDYGAWLKAESERLKRA